jgi:hypothetical protein
MTDIINQKTIKITIPKFKGVAEVSTLLGETIKINKEKAKITETRQKMKTLSALSIKIIQIYILFVRT